MKKKRINGREMGMTPLTPELEQYQRGVLARRQSPYLDYPMHVHLETLSLCPASCNFCPYPTLERQGNRMPDALIDKVFKDLKDMPPNLRFQISPFKVNEPFLDTRLFDILQRINRELPQASITLTTNASPLTAEKLKELSTIQNISFLWISVNDYRPEAYTKTMGLPWQRTWERLKMLHQAKEEGKLPFKVVLSRVGDGSEHDILFSLWVQEVFPLFQFSIFQRGGWLGQVDGLDLAEVPNVGCVRWFDISITSTGEVAHCCMDGQSQWPIGNVNNQHILEIYNQESYKKLRASALSRLEVEPCNQCTFL